MTVGLLTAARSGSFGADSLPYFSLAWAAALVSLLLLPSIIYALRSLSGREVSSRRRWHFPARLWGLLPLAWVAALICGEIISRQVSIVSLALPPFQVLAVLIPILFWVVYILDRVPPGSPHRTWGLASLDLLVTPPIVMLAEFLSLCIVAAGFAAWVSTRPDLLERLTISTQRLANAGMDPEVIERVIHPYLDQPVVLFLIFAAAAGLIPLIEEFLKPAALWLWSSRGLTPGQGFSMGLVCGAVFALLESMGMMASVSGEGWALFAVGRMGTGLLHMSASGLVGWGLASAWSQGRPLRAGLAYLAAVALHALWNVLSLLLGLSPYISRPAALVNLGQVAPLGLAVLMAVCMAVLAGVVRRLRTEK